MMAMITGVLVCVWLQGVVNAFALDRLAKARRPHNPYGWVDRLPGWVDWILIPRTKWRLRNNELPGKT